MSSVLWARVALLCLFFALPSLSHSQSRTAVEQEILFSSPPPAPWTGSGSGAELSPLSAQAGSCESLDRNEGIRRFMQRVRRSQDAGREQARHTANADISATQWLVVRRAMPEVADYFDDELERAEAHVDHARAVCYRSLDAGHLASPDLSLWRAQAAREVWLLATDRGAEPLASLFAAEEEKTSSGTVARQRFRDLGSLRALLRLGIHKASFSIDSKKGSQNLFSSENELFSWAERLLGGKSQGHGLPGSSAPGVGLWSLLEKQQNLVESGLRRALEAERGGGGNTSSLVQGWELGPQSLALLARYPQVGDAMLPALARLIATGHTLRRMLAIHSLLGAASEHAQARKHPSVQHDLRQLRERLYQDMRVLQLSEQVLGDIRMRLIKAAELLPP